MQPTMLGITLVTLLLTACAATVAQNHENIGQATDAELWAEYVDLTLGKRMAKGINGGYALVIYKDGAPLYERAEGYARMPWEEENPGVRMTLDTPVQLASVTKAITAVAFLKAWELKDKPFSLDDPFWHSIKKTQEWLTGINEDIRDKVTFRHLLTHQVGWGGFWDDWNSIRKSAVSQARKPMTRKLEEEYGYDNSNFYWLRMLTEDLMNVEFNAFMDHHINRGLGITTLSGKNPLPTLHYHNEGERAGTTFISNPPDNNWRVGADGAYASARDLARFLAGLRAGKILDGHTLTLMWPEDQPRGLGWHVAYRGAEGIGWHHNGAWGNAEGQSRTAIVHFPGGIDAVLICNNSMVDPLSTLIGGYQYTRGPANPELAVGTWRARDLTDGEQSVFEFDVTDRIRWAGRYQVNFTYRFGSHGVDLHRVTLLADGEAISEDKHVGWAGAVPHNTTYNLHVDQVREGIKYTVQIEIGGRNPDTNGEIELQYITP